MEKKRRPIRKKVQTMVLVISVAALLLTSLISVFSMLTIQNRVLSDGKELGDTAATNSESALLAQMEQNLLDIVSSKANLADSELGGFSGYIGQFSAYAEGLYEKSSAFVPVEVLPPYKENKGINKMQRYLANEEIALDDVRGEINLLGNLEHVFSPIINAESEMITTIYIGTESGFMLSYDSRSDLGDVTDSDEEYYDYFDSTWYTTAKESGKIVFTDTYPDSYGRGLTISCAAPFYREKQFAGVVCMDILIEDLNRTIIDIDVGEHSYAMLIDKSGKVIASPNMSSDQTEFDDIMNDETLPAYEVRDKLMSKEKGIALTSSGIYYAYTPVTSANWTFAIHVPASDITEPVEQIRKGINDKTNETATSMNRSILTAILIFIASFILIIAVVVVLARRFARKLTNPLLSLSSDVGKISGGNLNYRAEIHDNDEIGDLAGAFNDMALSLEHYISDLTAVTAEKERIGAELDVARQIQCSMLPCIFPAFPDRNEIDIFATMNPAKEVGGDFYDFFMVDERHLAIVMADVSGKGVPAALFMVIGKTLIKDHTQPERNLGEVFTKVNNLLCEANSEGLFITAFEGVLDLVTGEFDFVNAGHEMPFVCKAGEKFVPHKIKPGFVLAGMEDMKYRAGSLTLSPGDKIFQYTDGVTEATNANNELYGMERLEKVLNTVKEKDPTEILSAVKTDIDEFVAEAPQFDDITMLCLKYKQKMIVKKEDTK